MLLSRSSHKDREGRGGQEDLVHLWPTRKIAAFVCHSLTRGLAIEKIDIHQLVFVFWRHWSSQDRLQHVLNFSRLSLVSVVKEFNLKLPRNINALTCLFSQKSKDFQLGAVQRRTVVSNLFKHRTHCIRGKNVTVLVNSLLSEPFEQNLYLMISWGQVFREFEEKRVKFVGINGFVESSLFCKII